ncbi:hypothetical protein Peur_040096 [Populus x canadensis]
MGGFLLPLSSLPHKVYLFPVISSLHNLAVYGSHKFAAAFIAIKIMNRMLSLVMYIVIACFVCLDRSLVTGANSETRIKYWRRRSVQFVIDS